MDMTEKPELAANYEIHLEGYLEKCWEDWFDGMIISHLDNGETLLSGPVADQSALHGILIKLRDMNIKLISLNKV